MHSYRKINYVKSHPIKTIQKVKCPPLEIGFKLTYKLLAKLKAIL